MIKICNEKSYFDALAIFLGTSAAAQRVRANLYGALLNYLRIGKITNPSRNSDEERLKKANLEVLHGYGDAFLGKSFSRKKYHCGIFLREIQITYYVLL